MGTMRQLIEASGTERTWANFEGDAVEAYHEAVAKGVKALAGGKAEEVRVVRSRDTSWVSYKGQNRSDIDMEWHGTLITGMVDGHEVVLNSSYTSAAQGKKRIDRDVRARAGVATVQMMVDLFAEAFGQ